MSNTITSSFENKKIPIESTQKPVWEEFQKKVAKLEQGSQTEQLKRIHKIGSLCQRLGEWEEYLHYKKMLLSKATKWENAYYSVAANVGFGVYYTKKGQLEKSISYFEESLRIARKENIEKGIYSGLMNLGLNYSRLGNYEIALKCYLELYALNEVNLHKLENQLQKIRVLTSIGRMYVLLENEEKALDYFEEAKTNMQNPVLKSDVSIEHQFLVWSGLSKTYTYLKMYKSAFDSLSQFKDLTEQVNDDRALYIYNTDMGNLYFEKKNLCKSLHYFEEAVKYTETKDVLFYSSQGNIARCHTEMGEYQKALHYFEKALEGEEQISKNSLLSFYKLIQKTYLAIEEYKLAYEFLQKYTQLKEEVLGSKTRYIIAELENEREEKERIASQIKAFRAQINPHFIFNTLNSIQSYIAQNQSEDAQRFLASFASLMRQTLENSDVPLVKVADEVHFIQTYLTLEQLRFEQKFDFTIEIDEEVDIEALLMPPMLLQPYFENAILHGIQPKEEKGAILLKLIEKTEHLLFTITDNGVGCSIAKAQKNKLRSQHKSMGTKIQTDRLKALNNFYKKNIEVQTSDIISKSGEICGTKVELKVPIWEV